MLEIAEVEWKNFLSYGDYISKLQITGLGQCLITGEVIDEENRETYDTTGTRGKKSNGAGKSTIPNVIQWILFGRTMHAPNPGNSVVNWFTGKDCYGRITFKSGDFITRTRNTDGKNELLYVKNGDEKKLVADTLGTPQLQQAQLAKEFNLDWDIFCGSVFFNQYSKPWMEMADATRKKALERLLHVDRFGYYAKIAKDSISKLDLAVQANHNKVSTLETEIARLRAEIDRLKTASQTFDANKQARSDRALSEAESQDSQRDAIQLPDLEKLQAKWDIIQQAEQKVITQRRKANELGDDVNGYESVVRNVSGIINLWEKQDGKICIKCEQKIQHDHVTQKIEPMKVELATAETNLQTSTDAHAVVRKAIADMTKLIDERRPKTTMEDAKSVHSRWKQHDREAKRLRQTAAEILVESNPHDASITKVEQRIVKAEGEIEIIKAGSVRNELLNKHYNYIYKAYNDRTKVKSYIFQQHLPFINSRLKYYLEVFGLDVQIELTDALGIKSNKWGYQFESGGERKRTDVALMLATFDFHEQMYGRQCNTLVLDEVDGRLDDDGIDALINIIKHDIASKIETTLIISHRQNMNDVFPSEITVKRENRMSYISQVSK